MTVLMNVYIRRLCWVSREGRMKTSVGLRLRLEAPRV